MTFKTGLTPINKLGNADQGQMGIYRIKNPANANFFSGMPVAVSANGTLTVATNTNFPVGVLDSAVYIDTVTKRPVRTKFVPTGTSSEGASVS